MVPREGERRRAATGGRLPARHVHGASTGCTPTRARRSGCAARSEELRVGGIDGYFHPSDDGASIGFTRVRLASGAPSASVNRHVHAIVVGVAVHEGTGFRSLRAAFSIVASAWARRPCAWCTRIGLHRDYQRAFPVLPEAATARSTQRRFASSRHFASASERASTPMLLLLPGTLMVTKRTPERDHARFSG